MGRVAELGSFGDYTMTSASPLFALAGLGDVPGWMFILAFSIWPFHISSALGITTTMTLVGYGPVAVISQCLMLFLLLAAAPVVFRSSKIRFWLKTLYLPIGYPLVTLLTNLIPAFL